MYVYVCMSSQYCRTLLILTAHLALHRIVFLQYHWKNKYIYSCYVVMFNLSQKYHLTTQISLTCTSGYMAQVGLSYQLATFTDFENWRSLLLSKTFLSHIPREIQCALSTICLHLNWKGHMACNFNYLFESKKLLEITASHVHCKCGNISKTVPDSVIVTTANRKWYITYQIEAIPWAPEQSKKWYSWSWTRIHQEMR